MKLINDISKRHEESRNDIVVDSFKNRDFLKNPSEKAFFAYARKVEKIVTALYLVTDVMDADLPLTRSLRLESLELLNACYQLLTGTGGVNPSDLTRTLVRLEHVMSLVSIGKISHHISDMNAAVLLQELGRVGESMGMELEDLSRKYASYVAPRNAFAGSNQPVLSHAILDDTLFDEMAKNRKRQNDIKTTLTTSINDIVSDKTKRDNISDIPKSEASFKTTSKLSLNVKKEFSPRSGSGGTRRQEIMDVVTSHKNATMQDIQKFVQNCSEKTLQREVATLIAVGMVRREGDKRWATYHVA